MIDWHCSSQSDLVADHRASQRVALRLGPWARIVGVPFDLVLSVLVAVSSESIVVRMITRGAAAADHHAPDANWTGPDS